MSETPAPSRRGRVTRTAVRARSFARRPVAQTFAATLAINGFNILTGIILARALGPTGRGELAAAILWPTLMRFVVMVGALEAIAYRAARPGTRIGQLIGTAGGLAAVQDVILTALGLALLPVIFSGYSDTALTAAFLFLGTACIGTFGMYSLAILNGARKYTVFNVFRVAVIGLGAVAMIGLAAIDELTVTSAVLCYLAGVAPTTLLGIATLRRMFGRFERPDRQLRRSLLSYGWRTQLASQRNPLNEQLDQYAISVVLSASALGLYHVAFTLTSLIGFLSASISVVALPRTAATEDQQLQADSARRLIALSFATSVAIAIPVFVFADPLVDVLFGEAFAEAAAITRILLGAAIVIALTRVGASVLNGLGRPGEAGVSGLISLGGTAVAIAALIGPLGADGAALGALIGYGISAGWCLWRVGLALRMNPLTLLVPRRGDFRRTTD